MKNNTDKTAHNEKLGQVFTKTSVAKTMVNLFDLPKDARVLDPCFGDGVFIEALLQESFSNIVGYEIDSRFVNKLKSKKPNLEIYCKDFLATQEKYDGIIMNPPYIRQESIDNLVEYGISKKKIRRQEIFQWLPKTSNLYIFYYKSYRFTK